MVFFHHGEHFVCVLVADGGITKAVATELKVPTGTYMSASLTASLRCCTLACEHRLARSRLVLILSAPDENGNNLLSTLSLSRLVRLLPDHVTCACAQCLCFLHRATATEESLRLMPGSKTSGVALHDGRRSSHSDSRAGLTPSW